MLLGCTYKAVQQIETVAIVMHDPTAKFISQELASKFS